MSTDHSRVFEVLQDGGRRELAPGLEESALYVEVPEPSWSNGWIHKVGPIYADEARLLATQLLEAAASIERCDDAALQEYVERNTPS